MQPARPVAEVFPPGEFILEELEARGWSQTRLAKLLGRPVQTINMIVRGKKEITATTAIQLAEAFGTTPELWMNLETAYQLARAWSTYRPLPLANLRTLPRPRAKAQAAATRITMTSQAVPAKKAAGKAAASKRAMEGKPKSAKKRRTKKARKMMTQRQPR